MNPNFDLRKLHLEESYRSLCFNTFFFQETSFVFATGEEENRHWLRPYGKMAAAGYHLWLVYQKTFAWKCPLAGKVWGVPKAQMRARMYCD